jgi:subtilisin family serine protease
VRDPAGCSPPENFFNDPLYTSNEWVYNMINIRPVWESGYTGNGVRIRINDDGFDYNHAEVQDAM